LFTVSTATQRVASSVFRSSVIAAMAISAFILGFAMPVEKTAKPTEVVDSGSFSGRLVTFDR